MTPAQRAEARRLCDEASDLPWKNGADPCHYDAPEVSGPGFAYYVVRDEDAAFIAASRTLVPALLDECERLERELAAATERIDELCYTHNQLLESHVASQSARFVIQDRLATTERERDELRAALRAVGGEK